MAKQDRMIHDTKRFMAERRHARVQSDSVDHAQDRYRAWPRRRHHTQGHWGNDQRLIAFALTILSQWLLVATTLVQRSLQRLKMILLRFKREQFP
jgi:hypothetical protein